MRTITNYTHPMIAIVMGIVFSLSVSGQMSQDLRNTDKMLHESYFLSGKTVINDFISGPESLQLPNKSTQGSIPQDIQHFYWANTSIWMADYSRMDKYTSNGKILSQIFINSNTGDTINGIFYTYDSQGRIDYILHQNWINHSWVNDIKKMYSYDINGNELVYLELSWQGNNWNETYGRKYIYTYDANNHITVKILQFWNTNNDSWYNYDRYLFNYNENGYVNEYTVQWWLNNDWSSVVKELYTLSGSGVITERISQSWSNNNWVNSQKDVNIVWHGWNGYFNEPNEESYLRKTWNSGIWEDFSRVSTTYDAYGGWVQLQEYYSNNAWVNANRYTTSYDTHSNYIGYTTEMWNGFAWTIDFGDKNILTYNGNDVIECIFQLYDHALMVWYNVSKELYSNFIYTQGINYDFVSQDGLTLYPNPTSGMVYINTIDAGTDIQSLEVVNMKGEIVYQEQLNETILLGYYVDLTNYTKGIYLVKVKDASGIKVGKVIVR